MPVTPARKPAPKPALRRLAALFAVAASWCAALPAQAGVTDNLATSPPRWRWGTR
jgi:hypothetical protein